MEKFDLVVVGSGPGGYIAAIRAAQLGSRVAIVEKKDLGGLCLNLGCIPSKAILKSAELFHLMKRAGEYGLAVGEPTVDYAKVVARSRKVAGRMSRGVEFLMKKNKIAAFKGAARLSAPTRVLVERSEGEGGNVELSGDRVILATGTEPRELPGLSCDGKTILNSDQAILSSELPPAIAVIGGGAVGVEFAYWYNAFGSRVTLIEMADQLLPSTDPEIAGLLAKSFKRQGITTLTSARVESTSPKSDGLSLEVRTGDQTQTVDAAMVLVAVGRSARVADLGLDAAGAELRNGFIAVDDRYRAASPGLYAIGDVIGPPMLAHAASAEGVAVVEMMAGSGHGPLDPLRVPNCVYAQPEVASIGLTEEAAAARGIPVKIGRFPFRANGRAVGSGEEEGMVKLVADAKYGEILGAHLLGHGATELIAEIGLARTLEATAKEIQATVHAHPTLAEMMGEAALDIDGIALNI